MIRRIFRRIIPTKTLLIMSGILVISDIVGKVTVSGSNTSWLLWAGTLLSTGYINSRSSTPVSFVKRMIVIPFLSNFLSGFLVRLIAWRIFLIQNSYLTEVMDTPILHGDACYTFIKHFVSPSDGAVLRMMQYCNDVHNVTSKVFESITDAPWRNLIHFAAPLYIQCMQLRSNFAIVPLGQCPADGVFKNESHLRYVNSSYAAECAHIGGLLDDKLLALLHLIRETELIPKLDGSSGNSTLHYQDIDISKENQTFSERHTDDVDVALGLADW